jgi:uncharacterized protein (DUF983 family)
MQEENQEEKKIKCPKCYKMKFRYREFKFPHFKCDYCGAEWDSKEDE